MCEQRGERVKGMRTKRSIATKYSHHISLKMMANSKYQRCDEAATATATTKATTKQRTTCECTTLHCSLYVHIQTHTHNFIESTKLQCILNSSSGGGDDGGGDSSIQTHCTERDGEIMCGSRACKHASE